MNRTSAYYLENKTILIKFGLIEVKGKEREKKGEM